ncbi:hypothetical protein Tco_1283154 [Tanacetum coccineum]
MSNLKFAETHNLVAFLEKPEESDGFEGIIDFLNASSIRYALTVNPTIYTSCIKQFWATAKAKTVNGEVQIQALVDGKKVIVTKTSVRRALQLKDAEGTECLPNATIFEQLTLMGAKTTAWNEFSSTMASAIICLATNQKFNFSKYIFYNMVKNLEGGVKFLMYPRFVQVFLDKQVEGMTKHKEIYVTPSHTKKVFANMKGEGKGFSRRVTSLFQTMIIQAPEELGEGSEIPTDPQHTPTIIQLSTSQPQKKQPRRKQRKYTKVPQPSGSTEPITDEAANEEHVPIHSNDPLLSGEDRLKLNELMELCTNLSQRVLDLDNKKTSQAAEIAKLKEKVKKLERRNKSRTPGLKRLRKIGRTARIESSKDEGLGAQKDASKQGRKIADLDADPRKFEDEKQIIQIAEVTTVSATTTTVDELTLAQTLIEIKAAKPKVVTTAATTTTTTVTRPKARGVIVQEPSKFRTTSSSQTSQLPQAKDKGSKDDRTEKHEKEDQILIDEEIAQTLQLKLKQKLDESVEVKVDDEVEIKKHMEIVSDDEVAIDAIPLATKPPIIIDWKIIKERKMGYFQIIRADGSLRRPEEAYERVLWGDLKVMFEPDIESDVWRNLQGHKVIVWKLFSSSGVHFMRFQNLHIFMLVAKTYPLTPATITSMLNKKLQANHWNEMCYQLLKLMTKQVKNPRSV